MSRVNVLFALLFLMVCAQAIHPITPRTIKQLQNQPNEQAAGLNKRTPIPEYYYDGARLDHFNRQDQTVWSQRYFRNDSFWAPQLQGPVFIQIGGEGAISSAYVTDDFEMVEYAQKHHALVVALEHRFYGKSQPFGGSLTTSQLAYLSSQQALADVAQFIEWMIETWDGVTEDTQFVTFGCSYPGNLAAWFRMKYPQHTSGSVAGSAPVHAVLDFFQYLDVVDESLTSFTGVQCDARIANATQQIQSMLQSSSGQDQLQKDFDTCSPLDNPMDISTFMSDLMGVWMSTVQYNDEHGNPIDINYLCGIMNNQSYTPYQAYIEVYNVFRNEGDCMDVSFETMIKELSIPKALPFGVGFRQWTYQTCFEFGYFQTTDSPDSVQPFGDLVPISYYLTMCNNTFSPNNEIPMNVEGNVNQTNALYGGNEPHGTTKIVFANGSIDPWHSLSVTTDLNKSVHAVFIQGTAHCANTIPYVAGQYPVGLAQAQAEINDIIGQWLMQGNQ